MPRAAIRIELGLSPETVPTSGKTEHTFRRQDDGVIWFAGIWDRVTTLDAGEFSGFTILTGPSAGWLWDYHTRAPVILQPDEWADWLDVSRDPAEIIAAVRPDRFELAT